MGLFVEGCGRRSHELAQHRGGHAAILGVIERFGRDIGVVVAREEREKQRAARLRGRVVEVDVRRVQKPHQILAELQQIVERREQNEAFGDIPRFLADRLPEKSKSFDLRGGSRR